MLFPTELLLLVVDAVFESLWQDFSDPSADPTAQSRRATLSACALTCRTMRGHSQSLLFHDVSLARHSQYAPFARAIEESEHLAPLVKRMAIRHERGNVTDLPLPPHIIARLSNVRVLELRTTKYVCNFSPIFSTVAMLFAGSCLSLEELVLGQFTLASFRDVVRLLGSFPSIRRVTLDGLMWAFDERDGARFRTLDILPSHLKQKLPGLSLSLTG